MVTMEGRSIGPAFRTWHEWYTEHLIMVDIIVAATQQILYMEECRAW